MSKKTKKDKKPKRELDTTTTFANMNVEGFKWYDPTLEKRLKEKQQGINHPKVTRKEYFQLIRGAYAALWPVLLGVVAIFGLLVGIAYLWLS